MATNCKSLFPDNDARSMLRLSCSEAAGCQVNPPFPFLRITGQSTIDRLSLKGIVSAVGFTIDSVMVSQCNGSDSAGFKYNGR